jgi:hypothetical protein
VPDPLSTIAYTVNKYDFTIQDFVRSLERHGIQPELGALTPDNVATWQCDQEERGNSAHGIASRVIGLKVFSNKSSSRPWS